MKKFILLLSILGSFASFGQVLTEDFEGVVAPALPNGWTATTQAANGYTGFYTGDEVAANAAGYWPVLANGSASFAMTNDDVQNEILCNELLLSPVMDFTGLTNQQVSFLAYHDMNYGSGDATVEVSTDGGTTWVVEATLDASAAWETYVVNISAYDGLPAVWVGFRWNDGGDCAGVDNWGTGLAIDDVVVSAAPGFDAAIAETAPRAYTIVPLDQLSGPIGASATIVNTGAGDVTGATFISNVYDGTGALLYTETSAPIATIAGGANAAATVAGYTPITDDIYTIELIANISETDDVSNNDTLIYTLAITNTYARDAGSIDGALGVGAGTLASLGNSYEIFSPTTVSSVSFFCIPGQDGFGDTMNVEIYDMVSGLPNAVIGQSLDYIITALDTTVQGVFITLPVLDLNSAPLSLASGYYYAGVTEFTSVDNMSLAYSNDLFTPNTIFGSIAGAAFQPMEDFGFQVSFIVRPNFACNVETVQVSECSSYTWSANNQTYSESGLYTELLSDEFGCDSIITLDLLITGPSEGIDVQSACGSFTWVDGNTYTENNNSATFLLSDANGCDSTVTLDLTITLPTSGVDTQVACGDFEWIDGNTYAEANNTATFTISNAAGCDSVVTLDLSIVSLIETTDVQEACGSFTWIDGNTYIENTIATFMLASSNGCDSLVTLDLTITTVLQTIDSHEECGSFTWTDGVMYMESNSSATQTLLSVGGCDSIVTLDLTILPYPDNTTFVNGATITVDAFASSYTWFNCATGEVVPGETFQSFTAIESGEYFVVIDINGCENQSECIYVEVETSVLAENANQFELKIFPNPSNGVFNIELSELTVSEVELVLLDVSGKVFSIETFTTNSNKLTVPMNISDADAGIYFIRINAGKTITKRVIVSHK